MAGPLGSAFTALRTMRHPAAPFLCHATKKRGKENALGVGLRPPPRPSPGIRGFGLVVPLVRYGRTFGCTKIMAWRTGIGLRFPDRRPLLTGLCSYAALRRARAVGTSGLSRCTWSACAYQLGCTFVPIALRRWRVHRLSTFRQRTAAPGGIVGSASNAATTKSCLSTPGEPPEAGPGAAIPPASAGRRDCTYAAEGR